LIESYDNRASLAQIQKQSPKATIIIFHGERDGVIPVRMGRELAQTFPGIVPILPRARRGSRQRSGSSAERHYSWDELVNEIKFLDAIALCSITYDLRRAAKVDKLRV
jgi:hypothetical protein